MRMIGEISAFAAPRLPDGRRRGYAGPGGGEDPGSRALVPVDPVTASERPRYDARRPAAAFLAHLVATGQRAPQTRAGRRADPADAAAAYGTALIPAPMMGGLLRRCV